MKNYLELNVTNQIRWWPSQMFMIYILRDFNVMGLQIVIAWGINCSHVYEMIQSRCDISLSNVSPGNKGCLSIWHVDPQRLQLGMLHDWQLASILWRNPNPWSLAWLACSKIRMVVAMYGSCYHIESMPFEMNNFLVIPGDVFFDGGKVDTSLIALA